MPAPLSRDLRDRIVRAVEGGSSIRQAALRFAVSPSAAVKLMRRVRASGSPAPARFGGHRRPMLEPHEALVRSMLEAKSDISLVEIQAELRRHGVVVGATSTIGRWLRRAGLTHKKEPESGRAGPRGCGAGAAALAGVAALHGPEPVCLDETGTATNMTRRYGRCPRGARLVDATPWGHRKVTTFVAGLRASGIIAPLVLDGPMTGEVFRAYVAQMLAPALAPGDVVVMDNLAAHKVTGVREAIQAVGASLLYLPPYSPDLNPIEQLFAKLKALLRKAAARTKEALWSAIGELLDAFPERECRNHLTNCGYEFT